MADNWSEDNWEQQQSRIQVDNMQIAEGDDWTSGSQTDNKRTKKTAWHSNTGGQEETKHNSQDLFPVLGQEVHAENARGHQNNTSGNKSESQKQARGKNSVKQSNNVFEALQDENNEDDESDGESKSPTQPQGQEAPKKKGGRKKDRGKKIEANIQIATTEYQKIKGGLGTSQHQEEMKQKAFRNNATGSDRRNRDGNRYESSGFINFRNNNPASTTQEPRPPRRQDEGRSPPTKITRRAEPLEPEPVREAPVREEAPKVWRGNSQTEEAEPQQTQETGPKRKMFTSKKKDQIQSKIQEDKIKLAEKKRLEEEKKLQEEQNKAQEETKKPQEEAKRPAQTKIRRQEEKTGNEEVKKDGWGSAVQQPVAAKPKVRTNAWNGEIVKKK